ncbi:hypothetical protein HW560_15670 [Paenibacillus sp. E222]|uniref:hypothetical protein n=1 Tax=Paenibacillus sp. E222 TaxID=2748863 RepID=UPI0015C5DCA8|nr:hypothetical protein [Paenibacillus sp. E222]QLG39386.1 hypothetical protein HW560_15670 [Paenibacillus sp. E222]
MTNEERLIELQAELDETKKAIRVILGGAQEYRIGSRTVKKPDIGLLYEERTRLEREIQSLIEGNGIFRTVYFEGR